jgi:hypothetical protein
MVVPSQLALKTHTNFGYAANLATLDKLVNRFPLPPVPPPFGDTSFTHVRHIQLPTDGTIIYNKPVSCVTLYGIFDRKLMFLEEGYPSSPIN